MENQEIEALLKKYRKGSATAAEKALLESWYLQQDTDGIQSLSPGELEEDLISIGDDLPLKRAVVRRLNWWPRVAAAILIISFSGYFYWHHAHDNSGSARLVTHSAPAGKQQISLPDGSRVWVNTGSKLNWPGTFNKNIREVYLEGEAYFDVKHNAALPFVIHTGSVTTTVLGTAFNIRQDLKHHTVTVTVERGKVGVSNGTRRLGILLPDQQLSFNTDNRQVTQQRVDASLVIAWHKIDLNFDDMTLADVALQLEQHYHVRISFSNEQIGRSRFTGATLTGEKLEDVLQAICEFNQATYRVLPDHSIMISGKGRN
ncbi:FecR family protein [Mucilaginibacter sp. X5P1]|uniref:FecR family protein n=1 Tax=Mucilaginibacter sp. X5P1 TaxID=2723088 RepID=UPI00161D55FD|nr:FecR domain-containing protein [Mucilaginibacter sp. X5P1]MBB6137182.1 ferric-dicitrate binding protein FerR (iron transport regulator) [Mucilaginibacter sp. X5P1]